MAEMTLVVNIGSRMIGWRKRFGIINFMAPKATAMVTPDLFVFQE